MALEWASDLLYKIDTKAVITIHIQHHFNKVKNSNERIAQTKDFSTSY
jgi:hypothetical protein